MLVPSSNIAGVSYRPATDKQAMMCCVQTRGMGHRASGDWPLGDHGAFLEINDHNVAVTSHNISHRDVQSFSRRLDCDARGIAAGELNAAHQFGRFCIDYVDGSIRRSVLAAATKVFKYFDAALKQLCVSIANPCIRSPLRSTISCHIDLPC